MTDTFKLGVVFTHPTQHHGPLWKALNEQPGLSCKVLYLCDENQKSGDRLLGKASEAWDVDLTLGYEYEYLKDITGKVLSEQKPRVFCPKLISELTPQNYDAIFMQSFVNYSYRLTALLCRLRGIPLIMQNDATINSDGRYSRKRQISMAILYPWMLNFADYWLSCGDHNEIHLRHYGVADEKIIRGCHPVDGDRFEQTIAQNPEEIQQIRESLAWDEHTILYGFTAKYIDRKNPFEFIDGIVKAHQKNPRIRGVMMGGGDLDNAINQKLSSLHGEVINLGFVNQSKIPLYYAALDVFVVTSWIDPHPLVVSEAMVSGCVPLLSDRCGNWGYNDTVRHCYNGLVYPCGNSDALADSMLQLTKPEVLQEFSIKSKEIFHGQDLHFEVRAFLQAVERIKQSSTN